MMNQFDKNFFIKIKKKYIKATYMLSIYLIQ